MNKRDEMAKNLNETPLCTVPDIYFKAGWDAALLHDERVLALVVALENIMQEPWSTYPNCGPAKLAGEALTQYRESVK